MFFSARIVISRSRAQSMRMAEDAGPYSFTVMAESAQKKINTAVKATHLMSCALEEFAVLSKDRDLCDT